MPLPAVYEGVKIWIAQVWEDSERLYLLMKEGRLPWSYLTDSFILSLLNYALHLIAGESGKLGKKLCYKSEGCLIINVSRRKLKLSD